MRKDDQLQQIGHPFAVYLSILRESECIAYHGLEPESRPYCHPDKRLLLSGIPPVVRNSWRGDELNSQLSDCYPACNAKANLTVQHCESLLDSRMYMLPHYRTAGPYVEVYD